MNKNKVLLFVLALLLLQIFFTPLIKTARAESDEYFYSVNYTAYESSGDGFYDAVEVRMDVDTNDGTIGVSVVANLYDPYGNLLDSDNPSWIITGNAVDYGYAYLQVPGNSPVGYYDVQLYLYDEFGTYEDYRYDSDVVWLYAANYGFDEYFYSVVCTAYDSDGDSYNDAVTVTMDVDTTDESLGIYVYAELIDPNGVLADHDTPSWMITGAAAEYGYAYLYVPNGGVVGYYDVRLTLYDTWNNYEDYRYLTDTVYLYPPDYPSVADEYFYSVDYDAFDSNGDGYNDAIVVAMDVDTTDWTIEVTVVANLFDPNGDVVEVDVARWTITGAAIEYGYAYLHVPNGGLVGNYAFELLLSDEFGNYEDYELFYDIYLYPPDYVSGADEYFSSITYQAYDTNGDGWNDAVSVEMDVSTTDGTLDVFVYAYLIDSNGVYVDSDFPTWTITGVMPEYGYAYLYVPSSGQEGDYHVELLLYDEFANYEDYRYQLITGLYPPNYASDEYFYSVSYTPYDSNSDGWNDTVVVAMDVDTTDGTLGVNVAALLIDYYGVWVDSEYVSWTITGTVSDTFYVYLHVPDNATVYYYSVELFLYDQWDHDEDYRYGSNVVWLWPANYGSDEYFVSASPTAVDSNGDGYNDSVTVWVNADTDDHSLGVYVEAYLRDPNGAVVSFDNPDWGITGSNVELNYASLHVPNGSPVGYYDVEIYLYDWWGHLEDYRYFTDAVFLYPKNYPDFNGDGVVNVLDASAISAHWYPGPPVGPMGYDAKYDLNGDGAVDVLDAAIVSAYWTGPPKGPLAP